ncbi:MULTISPECIES: Holliday junction branch migration protein RuvA [unclassified Pseudofrankia]|uniref:Holliday junction branch migration protein RuvA n=1 Tax=unclassified Pseudofrankia TaxID=2994372 RepID=UPI0008D916FE|nr:MULTISPECIES: Holliday junction branch migration protein RuvA [unclassified Pseudofrankia]MDT3445323.1 Holliday junction branch migration protein RuvA [Pseudofrankia sp. BMG5.37]OHV45210.1 Holliday junction DNA helicase RuvA [Pseudofrankia sp. BMG5.36]
MIASVAGTVLSVSPTAAVVEVGGVGLLVQCTPATLAGLAAGEPARLATTLVVRETELTLYGFADADEREVFEILQAAGGVGPKLAQAVLGVLAPDDVRRAVAEEDLAVLTKVPGIGRKGAQRIVLDLKGKLGPPAGGATPRAGLGASASGRIMPTPRTAAEQVTDALVGLGYSTREAADAVEATGDGAEGDVSALLRSALAVLRPR